MHSLDDITGTIINAALLLHKDLGPGLLESVYQTVLGKMLEKRGFRVQQHLAVKFEYDGMLFDDCLRIDLVVEDVVLLELKAVEKLAPVHPRQLLTYLRLTGLQVGLLINFGAPTLKEGLRRIVNDLPASASPRLRVNSTPRSAHEKA